MSITITVFYDGHFAVEVQMPYGVEVSYSPESPSPQTVPGVVNHTGDCWNGDSMLSWDSERLCIEVAKYGDGEGGSLSLDIPTSAIATNIEDFRREWEVARAEYEADL